MVESVYFIITPNPFEDGAIVNWSQNGLIRKYYIKFGDTDDGDERTLQYQTHNPSYSYVINRAGCRTWMGMKLGTWLKRIFWTALGLGEHYSEWIPLHNVNELFLQYLLGVYPNYAPDGILPRPPGGWFANYNFSNEDNQKESAIRLLQGLLPYRHIDELFALRPGLKAVLEDRSNNIPY